jgi:hypothetical protein
VEAGLPCWFVYEDFSHFPLMNQLPRCLNHQIKFPILDCRPTDYQADSCRLGFCLQQFLLFGHRYFPLLSCCSARKVIKDSARSSNPHLLSH